MMYVIEKSISLDRWHAWVYKVTDEGLYFIRTLSQFTYPPDTNLWSWDAIEDCVFIHTEDRWDVLTEDELFLELL